MRNIPVFTTEFGVASLALSQIPYRAEAYVHIQSTGQPEAFIQECVQFCRACGARQVYATAHPYLEQYPVYTSVLSMSRPLEGVGEADACLMPVTEQTLARWLQIYNEKMADVDDAAFMDAAEGKMLLQQGCGYFIHRDGNLLGIGKACGETIEAVAAVQSGAGRTVVQALCHALSGPMAQLQVASTNVRAIRLYERLGFIKTGVVATWYRIG